MKQESVSMPGACEPVLTNVKPLTCGPLESEVIIATVAVGYISGT